MNECESNFEYDFLMDPTVGLIEILRQFSNERLNNRINIKGLKDKASLKLLWWLSSQSIIGKGELTS